MSPNHHRFTGKKPRSAHHISETTLKNRGKTALFSPATILRIFSEKLSRILRKIPHPEHVKILQPGLQHVDKPVVSIGIGRPQKEARLEHKILGIADDSFNHLAIVKIHSHPQARHNRGMLMKMKRSVTKISIEGLDEEDRLRVLGRDIFHGPGVQQLQTNGIKRVHRIVTQQLIDRPQLARLRQPPDGVVLIPDNDAIAT